MSVVRSNFKVTPPDLNRAVNSLADGTQKAVPCLYNLQTALINSLPPSRDSDTILRQFKTNRQRLQAEWNRFKDLLQHDYTYSEIYVLYVAGSSDLAKRLPLKAREAYREAVEIKERYEKLHQELQTYGDKVLSMLVGRSHVTHQPRLCEGTIPTIAQLALSWAHPDGPRALTESYSALQQISASLGDIVAFWEYHVDDPVSTSSAAIWRRSQDALLAAMRTISASADTICVDAVGAPSKAHNGNKPVKSPSILRKLLGIFGLG